MRRTREVTGRRVYSQPADGGSGTTAAVFLEDRLQALERPACAPPTPAAVAERLQEPIGRQRRLGLERPFHPCAAARGRVELPRLERLDAVELAAAPGGDYPPRPLDVDQRHVGPAEAVRALVDAVARARAGAGRVDPRQPPVLEVVVAELGVVGDVGEVVED